MIQPRSLRPKERVNTTLRSLAETPLRMATRITTNATVKLEMVSGASKITTIDLETEAEVAGIG